MFSGMADNGLVPSSSTAWAAEPSNDFRLIWPWCQLLLAPLRIKADLVVVCSKLGHILVLVSGILNGVVRGSSRGVQLILEF